MIQAIKEKWTDWMKSDSGRAVRNRIIKCVVLAVLSTLLLSGLCAYVLLSFDMGQYLSTAVSISAVLGLVMGASRLRRQRDFENIEHGSARWGTKKDFEPLRDKDPLNTIILSKTEQVSMDGRKTNLSNHVLVLGDPGSGKSRNYVKPNVAQMNSSYVITDPSGEHLYSEGKMLTDAGYKIKVFDITNPKNSMKFNPFHYYKTPKDIRRFIEVFMANTSGDKSHPQSNEDFWIKSERLWLMAHISLLMEKFGPENQNMESLLTLLNASMASEEDEKARSAIDYLFAEHEKIHTDSFAVKQYKKYKMAAGKTAKSILISIGVRLADFEIPEIQNLMSDDELDLDNLGMEKTALFIIMDESDTTYNYLVAILLDCLFQQNVNVAKQAPGRHLKYPLRCIIDEIANIGKIPKLDILISTTRKYWIFFELIFQDVSQIKARYKDEAQTILAVCPIKLFLGGSGEDTTKYISEQLLGKATIDTVSYGGSGNSGSIGKSSYSQNEQKAGRALMDQTELAQLPKEECIVFIKGFPPFHSKKYDVTQHPNYKLLADGDAGGFSFDRNAGKRRTIQTHYFTEIAD